MKILHAIALLFSVWHVGQVQNRTANRGEVDVPPAPNGVVTVYALRGCRPCYRMQAETKGKTDWDWRYVYAKHPAWVDSVPYVTWRGKDGKWYFVAGWTDFETWERSWRATQ